MMNQNNKQMENNPLFQRAKTMASGKSPAELEQIARNICQEKNINFDEAIAAFQKQNPQFS